MPVYTLNCKNVVGFSAEKIRNQHSSILTYLEEAIKNQEAGKEIKPEKNKALEREGSMHNILAAPNGKRPGNSAFKKAFSEDEA